ncbi:Mcm8 [Symbiodinium sp. KB8]|nr:Mcm8 [Symbiodinium sp. KB8]
MAAPASCPSSFDVLAAFEAAFDFYFDPEDTHASFRPDDPHVVLALEFFGMLREPLAPLIEGVDWARELVVHFNFDVSKGAVPWEECARLTREHAGAGGSVPRGTKRVECRGGRRASAARCWLRLKWMTSPPASAASVCLKRRDEPTVVFKSMSLSLCGYRALQLPPYTPPVKMLARVQNVRPIRPIRDIKADAIDSFMAVQGNVVRVGPVRPLVVAMAFQCAKCRVSVQCRFDQGKFEPPTRCLATRGCRSSKFEPLRDSAVTVDWQRIKIQEVETDVADAGRVPRSVDVELTEDLVDTCVPGDIVHVSGMIRSVNADVAAGRSAGSARHLFILFMEAHSVVAAKVSRSGSGDSKQFSERELELVRAIASHRDPFSLGEAVKAALCLGLFGGTHAASAAAMAEFGAAEEPGAPNLAGGGRGGAGSDRFKLRVRGDPHVLIVGDPGLGKSQMLRAVSGLTPRGVYVCGNTASGSGLTVTMVRDPDSGDFGLEAGALVLSDQGICCIDEFDKMGKEHQALLEAMEQQRISIAKAGMVASLSARTSVLAAANPVGGHYDRSKTVTENLRMHPALLSRFDLLFIILDRPDEERDRQLSAHVMALHDSARIERVNLLNDNAIRGEVPDRPAGGAADPGLGGLAGAQESRAGSGDFERRLRWAVAAIDDPVPPSLLRKYVAYARRFCHPSLSPAAALVLQDFYIDLRQRHGDDDTTPITTRQLESMVRLVQARAKIELRETVTRSDAMDVVQLMQRSLLDVAMDAMGTVDFSRSVGAGGMSMQRQVKAVVSALNRVARLRGTDKFSREDFDAVVADLRLQVTSVTDLLETLNQQSYILKKGPRLYQLLTSSS